MIFSLQLATFLSSPRPPAPPGAPRAPGQPRPPAADSFDAALDAGEAGGLSGSASWPVSFTRNGPNETETRNGHKNDVIIGSYR